MLTSSAEVSVRSSFRAAAAKIKEHLAPFTFHCMAMMPTSNHKDPQTLFVRGLPP